jgi:hypothetical protein
MRMLEIERSRFAATSVWRREVLAIPAPARRGPGVTDLDLWRKRLMARRGCATPAAALLPSTIDVVVSGAADRDRPDPRRPTWSTAGRDHDQYGPHADLDLPIIDGLSAAWTAAAR